MWSSTGSASWRARPGLLAAYEALDILAVRWATGRGNRNGRCAYQFARYWVGLQLLEQNK
jgi:predicted AAA+ superfamily ATPase